MTPKVEFAKCALQGKYQLRTLQPHALLVMSVSLQATSKQNASSALLAITMTQRVLRLARSVQIITRMTRKVALSAPLVLQDTSLLPLRSWAQSNALLAPKGISTTLQVKLVRGVLLVSLLIKWAPRVVPNVT